MRHFIAAQIILSSWAALVHGAAILTSPEQFTPPTIKIGFEAFPNGSPVPIGTLILHNQWKSQGFLITDQTNQGGTASGGTYDVPPHSGMRAISDVDRFTPGGFIEFQFVYPISGALGTVREAGIWVQNGDLPSTVTFYDFQGNLLETIMTVGEDFFAGLRATEGIARLRITDPDYFVVDDLQYTPVPEPGGLALAAIAVCALARRRRK